MHTTSFMIRMHAKASHVTAVSGCEVGGGEVGEVRRGEVRCAWTLAGEAAIPRKRMHAHG